MSKVHIETLKLTDFRNHVATTIHADQRHVVIFGENGAGKTNILEAVSFLSPGRGMRRAQYDKIGRAGGTGGWTVFAKLINGDDDTAIGTGLQQTPLGVDTQRKVQIDGTQAKTSDALLDYVRVLWLTPAMDGLFTGPASDRRRFLDRLVLAVDPTHGRRVSNFEKTMRARNKLLSEPYPDAAWLDANEAQLAELAVAVAYARHEMVALLSKSIVENNDPTSPFPDAVITLTGSLEDGIADISASDLEAEYLVRLKNSRSIDARAGSSVGRSPPVRSDGSPPTESNARRAMFDRGAESAVDWPCASPCEVGGRNRRVCADFVA